MKLNKYIHIYKEREKWSESITLDRLINKPLYRLQPQLQLLISLEYPNLESRLSSIYQLKEGKEESSNNNSNVAIIDLVSIDDNENPLSNTLSSQ